MELLRKSRIIQLLVILLGIHLQAHLINAQKIEVHPENVVVKEGGSTTITCRSPGQQITFCLFRINGSSALNVRDGFNQNGISYVGAGLASGECGINIERVQSINNGQVQCTLGVEGGPNGVIEGYGQIIVAKAAEPQIQVEYGQRNGLFSTEVPLRASCIVEHARPKAAIQWFLNDQPIQAVGRPNEQETAPGEFTTRVGIEYRLSPEDDGKDLICKAIQFSDDSENRATKLQLNIQYSPVAQEEFHVYGLDLGQTATINVTIRANPAPRVQWTVDGNAINEGDRYERYSANTPIPLGNGYYNVTFSIGGLTLEDTTKTYYFRASNQQGGRDYSVKISSSDKPLTAQGLEVGAIVGIVVACAILILVVLLIVFARLTGRWCFSGKSVKSPTNETGEVQQHGDDPGANTALLTNTKNGISIINNTKQNNINNSNQNQNTNQNNNLIDEGYSNRNSVYMPTTISIKDADLAKSRNTNPTTNNNLHPTTTSSQLLQPPIKRNNSNVSNSSGASSETGTNDLLAKGNQLGIPVESTRMSRWIPKDQRELLEKQAQLLASRITKPQRPQPQTTSQPQTTGQPQRQETEI